ncbi:uncharacterized protein LOC127873779 isoform X2 [Dreissena polymorpha]|uniref:uncharacterized protein LOC127873779 isoform X2 n=1 Tax=Dreissena polymorpha TaxID=45954 RepID=UPI00226401D2|nr:uncharacterized protein LOC127873779 isoform X2 [Dreissena polymorpha]
MDSGSVSSTSSARSTPVPTYKPITPSSSLLALSKTPDEDFRRKSNDELLQIIRRLEAENRNVVAEHSSILKDVNKRMQILLLELRGLKDINQSLQDDNQELRDLCCFLDDDRQRGRKLAKEWQRFGRYTASVMRSEVSAYQEKLKELEVKQQELITDNLDLKELCLYLDQERLRASQPRDEGDGSSSSTVAGNEDQQPDIELVPMSELQDNADKTADSDYVRKIDNRLKNIEKEKQSKEEVAGTQRLGPDGTRDNSNRGTSPHKPEAVVHAMKVLEVHENLERPLTAVGEDSALDDKEKAIVREMCNVVWRKLGNVQAEKQQSQTEGLSEPSTGPPVYENIGSSHSKLPEGAGNQSVSSVASEDNVYPPGYQQVQGRPDLIYAPRPDEKGSGYLVNPQYNDPVSNNDLDFQGQYQKTLHQAPIQRPLTSSSSYSQSFDYAPPQPHNYGNQPKYGYIHTSRSTPVTPTPLVQGPTGPPMQRMEPRSHSPGPVRRSMTPKGTEYYSQSPGPPSRLMGSQLDAPMSEGHSPVYQNQLQSMPRNDRSYENVTSAYYASPPSQNYGHAKPHDSSNYDYPPPQPNFTDNYYQGSRQVGSTQSGPNQRGPGPNPAHQRPPMSQDQRPQMLQGQNSSYYQNMAPGTRSQTPSKSNVRDPSPQGMRPTQQHPAALPQFSIHRATPTHPNVNNLQQPPQGVPSMQHVLPPRYNAPPSYQDRRMQGYSETRDPQQQQYERGRRETRDGYYKD